MRTPFCDIAVYYFADFYFDTNKENEENDTVSVNTVSENDTVSVHQIILFNNYSSKQQSFLCNYAIHTMCPSEIVPAPPPPTPQLVEACAHCL